MILLRNRNLRHDSPGNNPELSHLGLLPYSSKINQRRRAQLLPSRHVRHLHADRIRSTIAGGSGRASGGWRTGCFGARQWRPVVEPGHGHPWHAGYDMILLRNRNLRHDSPGNNPELSHLGLLPYSSKIMRMWEPAHSAWRALPPAKRSPVPPLVQPRQLCGLHPHLWARQVRERHSHPIRCRYDHQPL